MGIYIPPPSGGSGDMTKAVYDPNEDGKIAEAALLLNNATHSNTNDHAPGSDNQDLSGKENVGVAASLDHSNANDPTAGEKVVLGNTSGTNTGDNATNSQYSGLATSKQDTLVSGTNIKTINSASVLGSGDLVVTGSIPDTIVANIIPTEITTIATATQVSVLTGQYKITGTNALTISGTGRLRIF